MADRTRDVSEGDGSTSARSSGSTRPLVAFYLPQFHPVSLNDRLWGPGFTEWTNVAAARPLYRGHEQPRLPGELGFYDLRLAETRHDQARLATDHGIDAFCYWHYWYRGDRLLDRPFREVLADGEPAIPFCLGWANHDWTAAWAGRADEMILPFEDHGVADYEAHFADLLEAFRDPRYLRIDGRLVFHVYRPRALAEPRAFASTWQELAREHDLGGFLLTAEVNTAADCRWVVDNGFDYAALLPLKGLIARRSLPSRILGRLSRRPARMRYAEATRRFEAIYRDAPEAIPGVITNWDNTPRFGSRGTVLEDPDPAELGRHAAAVFDLAAQRDVPLVYLKSWNEWAEGNYIEPDRTTGRARLEAVRDARRARR